MDLGPIQVNIEGGMNYPLPPLVAVNQHFDNKQIVDINAAVAGALNSVSRADVAGMSIAITVGSRGITGLVEIVRALVAGLRERGADPFIVPAMGSHGGATTQGQIEVLSGYGITETTIGAPIRAAMDVIEMSRLDDGTPLFTDRIASEADGIIILNKIKPHADFKASYESGLVKMLCIGLANHKGAVALHDHGFANFNSILPGAAEHLLEKLPVLFAMAILENAFDELMAIELVPKDQILDREPELLTIAKQSIGRLKFPYIDVLIIDEIGKNISGEGMDPNVTGRPGSGLPGFDAPDIQKIVALDVTDESHGNGVGIGCTDFSTRRCVEKIDLGAMYTNAITATIVDPAKLPMILNSDRDAICVALKTCNLITPQTARIVRIRNTLELHKIWVSPALLDQVGLSDDLSVAGPEQPMRFDDADRLLAQT